METTIPKVIHELNHIRIGSGQLSTEIVGLMKNCQREWGSPWQTWLMTKFNFQITKFRSERKIEALNVCIL